MSSRTHQANRTAVAMLPRVLASSAVALALAMLLLAASPAGATAQPSPMLFPVAAYDGGGHAIDVPFWQRPGNAGVYSDTTGFVGFLVPAGQDIFAHLDPDSAFEGGPVPVAQCVAGFGCAIGVCSSSAMTLPFRTLTDPYGGCYGMLAGNLSVPGTWTVDVPITAEDDQANPLVFDHWSAPGAVTTMGAPANVPRCRTGDLGLVDGLDVQGFPDPQAAFTTAAEFRAWTDLPNVSGPTGYEAHYVPRSPDTTAPLIAISRPYDCRYVAKDEVVDPAFRCDDMGGSGVKSCAVTGDVTEDGKLDTSTTGEHSITVTATDNDGNTRTRTARFFVDGGPPDVTITASPAAPAGDNGWYGAAQLGAGQTLPLTVTATDTQAGMWRAWCSVDGAPEDKWINSTDNLDPQSFPPVTPVVAPITAYSIGQGIHTLSCHAEDRLGQDSGAVSRTFKVDTVAPPAVRFLSQFFDAVTYCYPPNSEQVAVFPAYVPRQVKWVADPDDASGLVAPAASGFLDADTTATALTRTLTAPSAVDAAGNSTPGNVCTYKVGPASSFVPASRTYDVRSGDRLSVPAPGVLTDSTGATPSTSLTILTLQNWSAGISGATFSGPSASGAFDATMPARSPSSSSISANYSWQGQEVASGLRTAPATVTVRLQQDTAQLVNGGTNGCQVTAYPVGRQLVGRQPTQVWGRSTYRCTEGAGTYTLTITLLRGSKKISSVAIPVGASATTSSVRLGAPTACATGDRTKYSTLVSLTGKGIRRAAQGQAVVACAGP
jgi:hypothetical protein